MAVDLNILRQGIYVNGEWRCPSGPTFRSLSPETADTIASLPNCGAKEVDDAVKAAKGALPAWSAIGVSRRCELLTALSQRLMDEYGEEGKPTPLKNLIAEETGKRLAEADIEVVESADMIGYFASNAPSLLADSEPQLDAELWPTKRSVVRMSPHGVVGVIKPWNYPLEIPIWSIAPALAAGNTIVFKPSEESPLVGLAVAQMADEVGFPPGVLNVLTGDGNTGEEVAKHPLVNLISFTGSISTGRKIAAKAAERLVPCKLELGGNDPALVLPDAQIDLAVNGIIWGSICNSGQVCVGIKRVIAIGSAYNPLVAGLTKKIALLRAGLDYGPIVSERQLATIDELVQEAVTAGATLAYGGNTLSENGPLYYSPTLLVDVPQTARIASEECFGPIIAVYKASSVDESIEIANASEYGLGASVWTSSNRTFEEMANRLECGMVWENDVNIAVPQGPWGGVKSSGIGTELSNAGITEYCIPRHIQFETGSETDRAWWYPYSND